MFFTEFSMKEFMNFNFMMLSCVDEYITLNLVHNL